MDLLILNEHYSPQYSSRIWQNARAGITVEFIIEPNTESTDLIKKAAGRHYLGLNLQEESNSQDFSDKIVNFMKKHSIDCLNITGSAIYRLEKFQCSQEYINYFIFEVLKNVHEKHSVVKVVSGGQTGVDLAGTVAALALKIPVTITMPNGFVQRYQENIDKENTKEEILAQIYKYVKILLDSNK